MHGSATTASSWWTGNVRVQEAHPALQSSVLEEVLSDFSCENSSPGHIQLLERLEMQSVASVPATSQLNSRVLGKPEQFGQ